MKSWLAKFRISTAMDAGKPLPESLRQKIASDPELERFARRTEALGRALRTVPPTESGLHDSIMRSVRSAARREQPRSAPTLSWLAASVAVAVLTISCIWGAFRRQTPPNQQSLNGAVMVLEMSEQMPNTMPKVVMGPLSDEWARVDQDVQDTTHVLLASFP
jgi:hypothetical protein